MVQPPQGIHTIRVEVAMKIPQVTHKNLNRAILFLSLILVGLTALGCAALGSRIPGTEANEKRKLMEDTLGQLVQHMESGDWDKVWDYFPPSFQDKYPREVYAQVMRDRGITYRKSDEPKWSYDNNTIVVRLPFHVEAPGRTARRSFKVNFRWMEDTAFGWVRDPERFMPQPGTVRLRTPTPPPPPAAAAGVPR
ncbi:MAG: hypothetical protein HY471_03000 [Candidatus Sungbacteria bacterium]|nr:hypothetical protein [Candidatus Sungbacteria bacterium]